VQQLLARLLLQQGLPDGALEQQGGAAQDTVQGAGSTAAAATAGMTESSSRSTICSMGCYIALGCWCVTSKLCCIEEDVIDPAKVTLWQLYLQMM
jgi:hypothetical protein